MNLSKYFYILFLIGIIAFFFSCSDWEQTVEIPNTKVTNSRRVVVIEDFTGTSCPNCPAGVAATEALLELYPDNIVVIGVHSNFLGQPASPGQVDLRTKDAQDVDVFLGGALFGKPEAAFNRFYDDNNQSYRYGSPNTWRVRAEEELNKPPKLDLKISTTYDSITRLLNVTLQVTGLEEINEAIHLHVGITESGIIADQIDNFDKIKDFEHSHVLREMITPIAGDKILDNLVTGQTFSKTYSFEIPTHAVLWKVENLSVFAYASLDANKKYILQAAEKKIL